MSSNYISDPMQEMFIFETSQQLQQLEQSVISTELLGAYSSDIINEIFRIMHTIKSSAAMMLFNNISTLAHNTEDLFYFIREDKPKDINISLLSDLVFEGIDFIKVELEKIKNGDVVDGDSEPLVKKIKEHLSELKQEFNSINSMNIINNNFDDSKKQYYVSFDKSAIKINNNIFKAVVRFHDDCGMENIRAFAVTHYLKDITDEFKFSPENIIENNESVEIIKRDGFLIHIKTDRNYIFLKDFFMQMEFIKNLDLVQLDSDEEYSNLNDEKVIAKINDTIIEKEMPSLNNNQSIISVNVQKLDKLMDLVGELVIAEAMVTQNTDLEGLSLDNFDKSARQLKKIASELQEIVMSIRMVPLGPTLFKMNRIVRDMSKKLNKEVHLDIIGEDIEVDKNIIEHLGDPLMHIIRNSIDHGIETIEERVNKGKSKAGVIILEAKNVGNEVQINIKDDGKGLNKDILVRKAQENGILNKDPEEMTNKEIFSLILLPGFSTNELVTEFSGRGVGMDVVNKNIKVVGGSIQIESYEGIGTTISLKIPLTLSIIDGMNIRVGKSRYTIPTALIKESFKPKKDEVVQDPDGNEMIMIRGQCCPILRLHEYYKISTNVTDINEGIMIMVESENKAVCIFADELIGQQQVVVKVLPNYIKNIMKINGISGCTLLGDGSISLILDVTNLLY